MRTKSVVSYIVVALAIMLTAEAAVELCLPIFSEIRALPDLPETRPYLIQVPDKPMTVFYDDGETINARDIQASEISKVVAERDLKDMMTFGISLFKDNTAIFLVWQNRPTQKLGRVRASHPFDGVTEDTYIAEPLATSSQPAPVAVAGSGNSVAFAWIGYSITNQNVMMLSRSVNAGQDTFDFQLKFFNPIAAAITFVEQVEMYGAQTFLGVYSTQTGGVNIFRAVDDPSADPGEEQVTLIPQGTTITHLSIAALKSKPNFVVTGQVQTFEGTVIGALIAVLDPDWNVVKSTMVDKFMKPSLQITPFDEIFVSFLSPDNSTCIQVFEDVQLQFNTISWCSEKYPMQAPSWSGLAVDDLNGYVAMTVVRDSQSVVDVYQCNFGCGNNVLSPIRDEQCELDGADCSNSCTCPQGYTPVPATRSCLAPQSPVPSVPQSSPLPATPTSSPTTVPTAPVSSADVLPILDCNARVNQTHYRTYLSYDTRTPGVLSVTVPIGDKNMFRPIAANQGQPTQFFAGRSTVYKTAVDITVTQPVDWLLTKYRLSIALTESNQCSTEILFQIGITSPTPPTESFLNATIDYVAWVFNVSSNNVSINVTQGEQPNEYLLSVSVQVTADAIIDAIEEIRSITEDSSEFEDSLKDINPDVTVNGVRGRPTDVDNPAIFEIEPIAPNSGSSTVIASVSLALSIAAVMSL